MSGTPARLKSTPLLRVEMKTFADILLRDAPG